MTNRHRLALRYGALGVLCVAACVVAAVAVLDREVAVPRGGLVPGITDELASGVPARAPKLAFERVPVDFRHFPGKRTRRLPEDMGSGVALEDLDGDGRPDLFFVNAGPQGTEPPPCAVFRNAGGGRFERVDTPLPALPGMGVAAGDYDADGDFDLYVTGYGKSVLLRNDGAFRFSDVTAAAGVAAPGFAAGACWGDADGDSDLDLYVCRYVVFDEGMPVKESRRGAHSLPATLNPSAFPAEPNLLYLNDGAGSFREAAAEMGVANPGGKSLQAVFADLDGDGVPDLYVANDVSDNALYRGRRGQPFEDATHASCTADWRGAMGLAVGDPDGDADLDLFVTHWLPEENTLYVKEEGRLVFRDDSLTTNLGPVARGLVGWACDFADFDADGLADLYVVNGSTFEERNAPLFLVPSRVQVFWNSGRRFHDLAPGAGPALQEPIVGRGGTSGDFDGDGRVDLVVVAHGAEPLVLRNTTEGAGNHLKVVVRGSAPNVFGYGARVTVEAAGRRQAQQVGARVSYLSSGPHELHFGLGAAEEARVVVRFPSGVEVVRSGVPKGTTLVVREVDPRTLGASMDAARDATPGEARRIYEEVLRRDPLHPGALYNLALLVEPERALDLCLRLLRVEPMAPRGHLLRAAILSDPSRPDLLDLDTALEEVAKARRLNRDETGGVLEEGRILLLQGRPAEAARRLEGVSQNPRAAALAALCRYRAGDAEAAERMLALHGGRKTPGFKEEGDTAAKKMGTRDVLARLLELRESERWNIRRLPLDRMDGAHCELVDVDGDGQLDACSGAWEVRMNELQVVGTRRGAGATPAPRTPFPPYDFEKAAAWALDPPERCEGPPPGATATCAADADGDGDEDLFVACGGDDPAAPLPWWVLLREKDGYRPVRGALPVPGFRVAALDAKDMDGDGRAEVLLKEGGLLPGDDGHLWLANLKTDS